MHSGGLIVSSTSPAIRITNCRFILSASDIGLWVQTKYRRIASESGYYHAAKALRKQGYPLELARAILLTKETL